ncbi:MAG: glutamine--fructose-6-phosphate aminotransferase [Candidatus Staskawiczbacteria bacterium RIFCSPLOWO2_01_FULL_38_12b]|uniref:Glutamine--fructose-6-phosphate aminotransferase [isomerizing] n=1 Tax=Candidatus Staskawiczbacteria bacterium RIFCSPLOWO2_01_FULL_38_12b TaxID=1802214 RepID=A0A1G2IB37_9BACT|nr:MAG: glutamine--fructose-6-phosphate aminotransferase [Candidatus Staskawiczbacteria bacterium RIFCSPLOWO2_01_FULL_38_12b]
MCGIVGYIGNREALPFLIGGLKKLEYRGYDSAGVCVKHANALHVVKEKGKVATLESAVSHQNNSMALTGTAGIAHTRWATHGVPNQINAHPHVDCKKEIAIVHNGIVENYRSLKELLKKEGHEIISDTDSEIIAHLVETFYSQSGDLEKSVAKALKLIEGTFGLLVICRREDKIIAAKKSSPLVIGLGNHEMFLASDVSALLGKTKKIIYLEDNEMAVIQKDGYEVKSANGAIVDKKIHQVSLTLQQIEKRGYKHFMLKEIFEQPEAIENVLRGRINHGSLKLGIDIPLHVVERIIITGCGTSWHSALIGKYIIEKIAGILVEVDYASELRYRDPLIKKNDLVVAISQSGETADTLAALQEAKTKGAKTIGIVNVVGSTIARQVDGGIYLHAGPEIGVASTKAFTCQVAALALFALHLRQVKTKKAPDKKIVEELTKLPQKIRTVLKQSEKIRTLAKSFKDSKNFLYLGRNINFPVALEGALKLKEISYIHAEGYPAAEMKHGPIALIDQHMPVVFLCPKDGVYQKVVSNMEEIKARGGTIIAITNQRDKKLAALAKHIIQVPTTLDYFSPIINVIPLQLLAYHIADLKGLNVDRPRNLAKSVTVE